MEEEGKSDLHLQISASNSNPRSALRQCRFRRSSVAGKSFCTTGSVGGGGGGIDICSSLSFPPPFLPSCLPAAVYIYPIPIRSILTLHSLDLFSFQIGWLSPGWLDGIAAPSDNEERRGPIAFSSSTHGVDSLLPSPSYFAPISNFCSSLPPSLLRSLDFPRFRWANRERQVSFLCP